MSETSGFMTLYLVRSHENFSQTLNNIVDILFWTGIFNPPVQIVNIKQRFHQNVWFLSLLFSSQSIQI